MNSPLDAPDQKRDASGNGIVAGIANVADKASFVVLDMALSCGTKLTSRVARDGDGRPVPDYRKRGQVA